MRRLALVLFLVACNGGDESPTTPGPNIPDIRGNYSSNTRFLTVRVTDVGSGASDQFTCGGNLNITSQTGTRYMGSMLWRCDPVASFDVTGSINASGGIVVEARRSGGPGGDWGGALGCSLITADPNFNGAVSGRSVNASASALIDCGRNGRLRMDVTLAGVR